MPVGVWFAAIACILVLAGLVLVSVLLLKLDARMCLRQIKLDARAGRWFGLTFQVEREPHGETVAKPSESGGHNARERATIPARDSEGSLPPPSPSGPVKPPGSEAGRGEIAGVSYRPRGAMPNRCGGQGGEGSSPRGGGA
jgi:hypothetical protein